jgi:dTDP-4-amino-4,6-dideoxygalactose transaminase
MFGIPIDMAKVYDVIKKSNFDICIIEDFAQALGSEYNHKVVGSVSGISLGSFGRGKNFSLYSGGMIAVNDDKYKVIIKKNYNELEVESMSKQLKSIIKFICFSIITIPNVYYFLAKFILELKSKQEKQDFPLFRMGNISNRFGGVLFRKWIKEYYKRIETGLFLHKNLDKLNGVSVPAYSVDSKIVYNRFPMIMKDNNIKNELYNKLWEIGIESSFMYKRAIHQIYDLGYTDKDLPNAVYLADHLLTLPVHGYVDKQVLDKMIGVIIETLK